MTRQPTPSPPAPPGRNGQNVRVPPYVYWYALAAGCALAALLGAFGDNQRHATGTGLNVVPLVISIISFGVARRSLRNTTVIASAADLHAGRILTRMIAVFLATAVFVMLTVKFDIAQDLFRLFFGN